MSDPAEPNAVPVDPSRQDDPRRVRVPAAELASIRLAIRRALFPDPVISPLRMAILAWIEATLDEFEWLACEPCPHPSDSAALIHYLDESASSATAAAVREITRGSPPDAGVAPVESPSAAGRRPSIRGKYAHLNLSSEDFAREKRAEIDREERIAR